MSTFIFMLAALLTALLVSRRTKRIGLALAAVPAAIFMVGLFAVSIIPNWPYWLAAVTFAATVFTIAYRQHRKQQHRELTTRADYEHQALLNGDSLTGIYGQYPPDHDSASSRG